MGSLFSFSKNVLKLSYSNAEFKTVPGDNTPVLGERKVCFRFPKMYQNSPTAMQNYKTISGVEPPDPRFWEGEVKVASF